MRLKNVPGAKEEMLVNRFVIQDPQKHRGNWQEVFGKNRPLYLEIGMGKGQFITGLAARDTDRNFLGIEKYSSALIKGVRKREEMECDNLYFLCFDAEYITQIFAPGEVSGIYLNFSDPWPKARHAKRRLTSVEFLRRYEQIMAEGAVIEFKTDNTELFEFSVKSAQLAGWRILGLSWDLHNDPVMNEGNIMTEYEEKFSSRGNCINKMIIAPPER